MECSKLKFFLNEDVPSSSVICYFGARKYPSFLTSINVQLLTVCSRDAKNLRNSHVVLLWVKINCILLAQPKPTIFCVLSPCSVLRLAIINIFRCCWKMFTSWTRSSWRKLPSVLVRISNASEDCPYYMSRGGESVASFIEVVERRFVWNCCGKMWRLSLGFLRRMLFYNWPRREQTFLKKTERTFLSHHATRVNGQIVKCTCYAMNWNCGLIVNLL